MVLTFSFLGDYSFFSSSYFFAVCGGAYSPSTFERISFMSLEIQLNFNLTGLIVALHL